MNESDYNAPLDLYMSFEYLPMEQQARILSAINGVYKTIIESQQTIWPELELWFFLRRRFREYYFYEDHYFSPPLCIVSARTGDSIKFKFDIERKIIPRIVPNGEDIDILVPQWTAAVMLAGAFIVGGMHTYGEYLDIKKSSLEIEKLQREVEKLQTESLTDKNSPLHNKLQVHLNQFYQEINKPNITNVDVNGHSIKRTRNHGGGVR